MLFAFVVLGLVSSLPRQEIGWEERFQNNLFLRPVGPKRQSISQCGDRLERKGENYQVCSVQYCVQQLCTVRCIHI